MQMTVLLNRGMLINRTQLHIVAEPPVWEELILQP